MIEKIKDRFILCRLTWMNKYEGTTNEDTASKGGKYPKNNKRGMEDLNFLGHKKVDDTKENVYGYVAVNTNRKTDSGYQPINLEAIDESIKPGCISIDNVTVIFFATRPKPEKGQFVVGWYKNATVYREIQTRPGECKYKMPKKLPQSYKYYFKAKKSDSYVIPNPSEDKDIQRNQSVPHKRDPIKFGTHRGGVYYRKDPTKELIEKKWMDEALDYVNDPDNNNK